MIREAETPRALRPLTPETVVEEHHEAVIRVQKLVNSVLGKELAEHVQIRQGTESTSHGTPYGITRVYHHTTLDLPPAILEKITQKTWDKIAKGIGILERKLGAVDLGERNSRAGVNSNLLRANLKLLNGLYKIEPGRIYHSEDLAAKYGQNTKQREAEWRAQMERDRAMSPENFLELFPGEKVHTPSGTASITIWSAYLQQAQLGRH